MLNILMASMNAREDIFTLGPLSHIIAREYTQMTNIKQRRRVLENMLFVFFSSNFFHFSSPVKIKSLCY
jgi:hypothetical protein